MASGIRFVEALVADGDQSRVQVAGEISETMTERLEFYRFDESLLVFTSRAITGTPPT
jgi:hypothetical protein